MNKNMKVIRNNYNILILSLFEDLCLFKKLFRLLIIDLIFL